MKKPLARVLLVEDHPDIGTLMRAALSRALVETTVIASGEEALRHLTTATYDLILLDIALPGLSGIEVCRQLKADPQLQHLPVIFVSGKTAPACKAEALRLGAVDFIEKPFSLLPFLSCIMGHLNLRSAGDCAAREGAAITAANSGEKLRAFASAPSH